MSTRTSLRSVPPGVCAVLASAISTRQEPWLGVLSHPCVCVIIAHRDNPYRKPPPYRNVHIWLRMCNGVAYGGRKKIAEVGVLCYDEWEYSNIGWIGHGGYDFFRKGSCHPKRWTTHVGPPAAKWRIYM